MVELTVAQKHVGIIAGCIGLLQSTAWYLLSIICIVWHFEGLTFILDNPSYQDLWEMATYSRFLSNDVILPNNYAATPTTIAVFCFFYLFLCAAWFGFSFVLVWGIHRNHARVPLVFRLWGYNAGMITLADIVLFVIVSIDYGACQEVTAFTPIMLLENEAMCTNIFVPVMTIVARGYVLLLVNIGFCIYSIKIGKELGIKAHQGNVIATNPYAATSGSGSTIPRAVVQQTPNPYQQNAYQQYPPPSGSNQYQTGQPQNWGNSLPTIPTKPTGSYPAQQRQVY